MAVTVVKSVVFHGFQIDPVTEKSGAATVNPAHILDWRRLSSIRRGVCLAVVEWIPEGCGARF